MATYHGQTVDVAEGFEGTYPPTGWTETDASAKVSQSAAAKYEGTYGLRYDVAGAAAGYITYDIGADKTSLSWGLWAYFPTWTNWGGRWINLAIQDGSSNSVCRVYYGKDAGGNVYGVTCRNNAGDMSSEITGVTAGNWYWITGKLTQNGTMYLRVYDTTQALVGAEVTITTGNFTARKFIISTETAGIPATGDMYWDGVTMDWTTAAFPLRGWDVAAPAWTPRVTLIPQMGPIHTFGGM